MATTAQPDRPYLTTTEVGRVLDCTQQHVLTLVKKGALAGIRTPAGTIIRAEDARVLAAARAEAPRDTRGHIMPHKRPDTASGV